MRWRSFAETRYFEGVCLGLLLFTVFASATIILVNFEAKRIADLENYFFGTIAFLAAYASVRTINRQIKQQIEQHEDSINRKKRVKQVSLALAAVKSNAILVRMIRWHLDPPNNPQPNISEFDEMIRDFSDFCEFASENEYKFIASLLSIFQVLTSRLNINSSNFLSNYNSTHPPTQMIVRMNADAEAINWAILACLLDEVLFWARDPRAGMRRAEPSTDQISRQIGDAWMLPNVVSTKPSSVVRIDQTLISRKQQGSVIPSWMRNFGIGL